jgi:hypothetical protein
MPRNACNETLLHQLHDLQGITGWHVLLHAKPFYIELHAFTWIYMSLQEKTRITCSRHIPSDFEIGGYVP